MSFYMRSAAAIRLQELGESAEESTIDRLAAYKDRYLEFIETEIGYEFKQAQVDMLETCTSLEKPRQHCICSATGFGKTFFLTCYIVARFLIDGAQPGRDGRPKGFLVIWLGPDQSTVIDNVWRKVIGIYSRLEDRGWVLPGDFYTKHPQWELERENWFMKVSAPPKSQGGTAAGAVSGNLLGRHHEQMIVAYEEGSHIRAEQINGAIAMLTGEDNELLGAMNPTIARGPVYAAIQSGSFTSTHYAAFDHPNVIQRETVIEGGGTGHTKLEHRIRYQCQDMGSARGAEIDPEKYEFVYALPPHGLIDSGNTRDDDIRGHRDGEPRIYRPKPEYEGLFCGQVLGIFPSQTQNGIFNMRGVKACQDQWNAALIATLGPPDRVGVDPSRSGADDYVAVPCWGPQVRLLRDLWKSLGDAPSADKIKHRAIFGNPVKLPKSSDADFLRTARKLIDDYGTSPTYQIDAGYGSSVIDQLRRRGCRVHEVHFSGRPSKPLPGMRMPENNRAAMHFELAWAVNAGLCSLPPSTALREELSSIECEPSERAPQLASRVKNADRMTVYKLISKEEIKALLGRSPGESDATALAFYTVPTGTSVGARGGALVFGPDGSSA